MNASQGERIMLNDFDEVNAILAGMRDDGLIEPIDDPSIQTDFYDWAEIVGVDVDDWIPAEYTV
jgi:hypothetical protein